MRHLFMPILNPVQDNGKFSKATGWLEGKTVQQANPMVIEHLENRGLLFKKEKIRHRYPCCWRCSEELVYRAVDGWYIKSEEIKPLLKKETNKTYWYPEADRKRMQQWLDGLRDWNISRKRYWGNPLPFWFCEDGHLTVIGTIAGLKKKAIRGIEQLKELHRPWIDNVTINCDTCGKEAKRTKLVGDCWLDAGVMPYSTTKYLHDKEYWKKWFPADFITEMHEQVRLWFYSMLFISCTLEGKIPYKNVLGHGMVLAEDGREMHKSWGNAIWADEALTKMGGDVMRWMYTNANPSLPVRFGYGIAREVRNNLNVLLNTSKFVKLYMDINKHKPGRAVPKSFENKWILSHLNNTIKEYAQHMDKLEVHLAKRKLEDFFLNDFSRWYVKLVRGKVKKDYADKEVLNTLYKVMLDTTKMTAPFLPFLSEAMYQNFAKNKKESVHLLLLPKAGKTNAKAEKEMEKVKETVERVLSIRDEAGLRVRWPVQTVYTKARFSKEAKSIVADMCNALEVKVTKTKPKGSKGKSGVYVDVSVNPKLRELGLFREVTRQVQAFRKQCKFRVGDAKEIMYDTSEELRKIIEKRHDELFKLTSTKLVKGKADKAFKVEFHGETHTIKLGK